MKAIFLDPDEIQLLPANSQQSRSRRRLTWALSPSSLQNEDSHDLAEFLHCSGDHPFWFDGGVNGDLKEPVKVGTGDGRRTQFFLPNRHVFAPSLVVRVREKIESNWTLDEPSGLITFAVPPVGGAPITALYRCRFKCTLSLTENGMIIEEVPWSADADISSFRLPGLVDPNGRPITQDGQSYNAIVTDIRDVNERLLRELADHPEILWKLSPRMFEEIVAEIFARMGYEVTLTPSTRDGGKDIYAVAKTDVGSFLYIVECKKYAPDRPVGVGLVRSLNGVVEEERATVGIIATTSYFTKGANEFQRKLPYRIALKDFLEIRNWIMKVTKTSINSNFDFRKFDPGPTSSS